MRYFKDQWSNTVVKIPEDDKWNYNEMKTNPDYKELSEKEYKELTSKVKED
jgi:hypothetical protein